ncbi:MAG: hypothetical protein V3V56_07105 [bacterium]
MGVRLSDFFGHLARDVDDQLEGKAGHHRADDLGGDGEEHCFFAGEGGGGPGYMLKQRHLAEYLARLQTGHLVAADGYGNFPGKNQEEIIGDVPFREYLLPVPEGTLVAHGKEFGDFIVLHIGEKRVVPVEHFDDVVQLGGMIGVSAGRGH